jgi:methylmalonyl-CoA mutase C-terminal domain/subunit
MPPSSWVASTKPEAALVLAKACSLGKDEGGLWRRVIAGQGPACIAGWDTRLLIVAGKIRVVIAKPGLDGHDRGAKIIARALRDAGMEVIYTGLHQTPEQIVETAIQEDADAVGISILSGAHMTLVPRILEGLKENGAEDVLVVVGGTIPDEDAAELTSQGVAAIFTPGAPTAEIVDFLKQKVLVS